MTKKNTKKRENKLENIALQINNIIIAIFLLTTMVIISSCVGFTAFIYFQSIQGGLYASVFISCAVSSITFTVILSLDQWVKELEKKRSK